MVVSSMIDYLILYISVVDIRSERGEVAIKKMGTDEEPKTFTFDSVYAPG